MWKWIAGCVIALIVLMGIVLVSCCIVCAGKKYEHGGVKLEGVVIIGFVNHNILTGGKVGPN